jgi:catechol 2,3-dioxygenase-like lactoylglutathione lyase family enzyme
MTGPGLHHIGLTVSDLEQSVHFYRDLLGLAVRERDEVKGGQIESITGVASGHVLIADLDFGGGRTLELTQYLAPPGSAVHPRPVDAGHVHVGVEVDDIEAVYARLTTAGVLTRSKPTALVDAGPFWSGAKVMHALDPDGVTVELVEMPR